ncbi:uncharacterized protein LOC124949257 [Vespa velutina]|uniref:uncharacterized protein LOC124949257 n=1 Tax=Vespa velutina TaxID=202808 RepID=UPI001FB38E3F|nr:uncharacterized protein LOC124949257 [Vespa velutina]XP_047350005.1 uncharacterized protein LOC124949257 [Vespa velutina]
MEICGIIEKSFGDVDNRIHSRTKSDTLAASSRLHKDLNNLKWFPRSLLITMPNSRIFWNLTSPRPPNCSIVRLEWFLYCRLAAAVRTTLKSQLCENVRTHYTSDGRRWKMAFSNVSLKNLSFVRTTMLMERILQRY